MWHVIPIIKLANIYLVLLVAGTHLTYYGYYNIQLLKQFRKWTLSLIIFILQRRKLRRYGEVKDLAQVTELRNEGGSSRACALPFSEYGFSSHKLSL